MKQSWFAYTVSCTPISIVNNRSIAHKQHLRLLSTAITKFSSKKFSDDDQNTNQGTFPLTDDRVKDLLNKATHLDPEDKITHFDSEGKILMVDVNEKADSVRTATAEARVQLGRDVYKLVSSRAVRKGNVMAAAKLAGILGAKLTSQIIPLCHNITLAKVDVDLKLESANYELVITSFVKSTGKTGVEMEALMAVSVAALTVYDMCKAASHGITIENIKLTCKTGGKKDYYENNNDCQM